MLKEELKIVIFCNKLGSGRLDVPLRFINSISFLAVMWLSLTLVAIARNPWITKPFAWAVLVVTLLHFTITEGIIKHALIHVFPKRLRPYVAHPEKIKAIGRRFSDSSFPSSHMATTVAMFYVIVSFYPSLLLVALLFTLIMAFSRLHNGMHYPSDLLAGTALGLAYGWIAMYLVR